MTKLISILAIFIPAFLSIAVVSNGFARNLIIKANGNGSGTVSTSDIDINYQYPEAKSQSVSLHNNSRDRVIRITAAGNGSRVSWSGQCNYVEQQTLSSSTCFIMDKRIGTTRSQAPVMATATFSSCNPSIDPIYATFPSEGGIGRVEMEMPGCGWQATSNADWITMTEGVGVSGGNFYSIAYSVTANNTGSTRSGTITVAGLTHTVIQGSASRVSKVGIFSEGKWYFDANSDGCIYTPLYTKCPYGVASDDVSYESVYSNFGGHLYDAIPVMGDWDGKNIKRAGVFSSGVWYFDMNDNGILDRQLVCDYISCKNVSVYSDPIAVFGQGGDIPVVGDWTGDGKDKIGVFSNGTWYLDLNGNGIFDGCSIDACYTFGQAGDIPVVGDWTGDGKDKIGVFRQGTWLLDMNGDGKWMGSDHCGPREKCMVRRDADLSFAFGLPTDIPVVGDWNGDGKSKIGVYRNGTWYLDMDDVGIWNGVVKTITNFGGAGWIPVVGN